VQVLANIIQVLASGGICQIFYINKIPIFSIFYFEPIVSFCAIIYSNKKITPVVL